MSRIYSVCWFGTIIIGVLAGAVHAGAAHAQSVEQTDTDVLEIPKGEPPDPEEAADVQQVGKLLFQQTNEFRKKHDLPALQHNQKLQETARYFAQYMARTRRYGHMADGKRPAQRAEEHGYEYCIVRENIAYSYKSKGYDTQPLAEQFLTGWIESKGHRENMLSPFVTESAVAVARSKETGYYLAVQMFGRPQSAQISVRFVNRTEVEVEYTLFTQDQVESDNEFSLPPRLIRSHERCRPTSFRFSFMDEDKRIAVESGTTYLVVKSEEGELQVAKQPTEQSESEAEASSTRSD